VGTFIQNGRYTHSQLYAQLPSYQQKKRRSTKEKMDRITLIKMNYLENGRTFLPNSEKALPLGGFRPSSVCLFGKNNKQMKNGVHHWLNDTDRETEGLGENPCPSVTSSTTNVTWPVLLSNPAVRVE